MNVAAVPENSGNPRVLTNWCVITGAPCSGKTSVIQRLAAIGHRVVHEVARAFIDSRLAQGASLPEIKADTLAFERHILLEKVRLEESLPKSQMVFLDRAVPDSIAYFQLEGLDTAEPLRRSRSLRYWRIFLFDRLNFETDPVRSENHAIADRIEALLLETYAKLGYDVIRVPVLTIQERVDFVLSQCHGSNH